MCGQSLRPIIGDLRRCSDYQFENIDSQLLLFLKQRAAALARHRRCNANRCLLALECFLQISGQTLNKADLKKGQFATTCQQFLGALFSTDFISMGEKTRGHMVAAFCYLFALPPPPTGCTLIKSRELAQRQTQQLYIAAFKALTLDAEKVQIWHGWPISSRGGTIHWLPLQKISHTLGVEFAERFRDAMDTYASTQRAPALRWLRCFANFISTYPNRGISSFRDSSFMSVFWRHFAKELITTQYRNSRTGHLTSTLILWNVQVRKIIQNFLTTPELFAKPTSAPPCLRSKDARKLRPKIKTTEDGVKVQEVLLTSIPLDVTDEQALRILFNDIKSDYNTVLHWANSKIADTWRRFEERMENIPKGEIRVLAYVNWRRNGPHIDLDDQMLWLTSRKNPDHLKNAAATCWFYGHAELPLPASLIYPEPSAQTAYELAFPITGALLPHCIILVSEHPKITAAFLEQFELYDDSGRLTGLRKTDAGWYLVGAKRRRGPELAEQQILLSEKALAVVRQIMALTFTVRQHLKSIENDDWRYLLLTCGQGFGKPHRIRNLSSETSISGRNVARALELRNLCNISDEKSVQLVNRLSLPSFRATAAVLVYLETQSVLAMAEALGHDKYAPKLLFRYLPKSIVDFFQDRWIRIFQTGIILEALKDSPFRVEAAGFSSMSDMESFLKTNTFQFIHAQENSSGKSPSHGIEVVFGVSMDIIVVLLEIQGAVENSAFAGPLCSYWAAVSRELVRYIEAQSDSRGDLAQMLVQAKIKANPRNMEAFVHE